MVNYGTGTVSADGTQVIPNVDPDHPGHSYGLVHFDWHGPAQQANDEDLCPDCTPTPDFFATVCPECGDPIDLSSGLAVLRETDLAISGLRGGIAITRISRNLAFRDPVPPFGIGTSHNYAYRLNTSSPATSAVINLITPDGSQFPFVKQPDGTLINTTIPAVLGAVMRVRPDGLVDLRWKNGTIFRFQPVAAAHATATSTRVISAIRTTGQNLFGTL
jgi:hypothetical protein